MRLEKLPDPLRHYETCARIPLTAITYKMKRAQGIRAAAA